MAKAIGKWIASRRCFVCNELKYDSQKKKFVVDPEKRAGYMRDPNNPDKWIPCTCNNKGYNTTRGTLST